MPLFLVGDEVLKEKLECVVSPIRGRKLYHFDDIDQKIFEKAGKNELIREMRRNSLLQMSTPFLSKGVNLSNVVIHIYVADLVLSPNFQEDLYNSYHDTMKKILIGRYQKVIFPPMPYSFKRLGQMNSYRTAVTLIRYFMDMYCIRSTIFIWCQKREVNDHLQNYVSTYVSTSALSRRHKPLYYPLTKESDIKPFEQVHPNLHKSSYRGHRNYSFNLLNKKFEKLFWLSKELYEDEYSFCESANIHIFQYRKYMEEEDYIPSKNEFIAILVALKLNIVEINEYLLLYKFEILDESNSWDSIIMNFVKQQKYDVYCINEVMFLNDLPQLGSYCNPYL